MNTHMHTHVYTHRDEGVWFPDGIQLQLAWSGSGSAADSYKESSFNPFADIPEPLVARSFVEDLDCDAESLQWWVGFGLRLLHARLWKIWTAMPSPCSGGSVRIGLVARSFVEDLDCDAESLQWWVGFGLRLLHARLWKIWTAMPSPCSGGSVSDWACCTLVCGRFGLRCRVLAVVGRFWIGLVARSFVEDLDCDAESLQRWVGFGLG